MSSARDVGLVTRGTTFLDHQESLPVRSNVVVCIAVIWPNRKVSLFKEDFRLSGTKLRLELHGNDHHFVKVEAPIEELIAFWGPNGRTRAIRGFRCRRPSTSLSEVEAWRRSSSDATCVQIV